MAVAAEAAPLDRVFSALADPTRRGIITQLARGPATVTEIARPIAMSLPSVSRHLKVLEAAQLIRRERLGRVHRMHLRGEAMALAHDFLETYRGFWEGNLDALAAYLEDGADL